ncbi:hypothetical protein F5050DRAFT_186350 [Lentinula boryana]|uniref:Uncharacterized protein n=1 Tax=Lentinula boryana TaxID=40481 RepID=A0ABQ8QBU3_9AGAR|nr:hypothetical protein F5050DRAFT_186350 [Lentinula boryana]
MVNLCTFIAVFFALGTVLAAPILESHNLVVRVPNQEGSSVPSQPTTQGHNPGSKQGLSDEKKMISYLENNGHTSDEKSYGRSNTSRSSTMNSNLRIISRVLGPVLLGKIALEIYPYDRSCYWTTRKYLARMTLNKSLLIDPELLAVMCPSFGSWTSWSSIDRCSFVLHAKYDVKL